MKHQSLAIVQDLIFDLSIDSINNYVLGETSQKENKAKEKRKSESKCKWCEEFLKVETLAEKFLLSGTPHTTCSLTPRM